MYDIAEISQIFAFRIKILTKFLFLLENDDHKHKIVVKSMYNTDYTFFHANNSEQLPKERHFFDQKRNITYMNNLSFLYFI